MSYICMSEICCNFQCVKEYLPVPKSFESNNQVFFKSLSVLKKTPSVWPHIRDQLVSVYGLYAAAQTSLDPMRHWCKVSEVSGEQRRRWDYHHNNPNIRSDTNHTQRRYKLALFIVFLYIFVSTQNLGKKDLWEHGFGDPGTRFSS